MGELESHLNVVCVMMLNGLLIPDKEPLRMCEKSSMAVDLYHCAFFIKKLFFSHTHLHTILIDTLASRCREMFCWLLTSLRMAG